MYCSKCGKKLNDDAQFCFNCGTRMDSQKRIMTSQQREVNTSSHKASTNLKKDSDVKKKENSNMKALVCELCGSNDIVKQGGVFVCQHCGTKYSVEEAKKLIGVVQIDKSQDTENLLILARRARDENNEVNAAKYYDMVLRNDPTNWEASFYQVYFQAMGCKIGQIRSAADSISNNICQTIPLIRKHVPKEQQEAALKEVAARSIYIANLLASAARKHYNEYSTTNNALSEYADRIVGAIGICGYLEAAIKDYLPEETKVLVFVQKEFLEIISEYGEKISFSPQIKQWYNRLKSEIHKEDSSYDPPEIKKSGCYIATCVYGAYDCPPVWTLRRFRDYSLSNSWYRRTFIRLYYAISPTLVKWFGNAKWFKHFWKKNLDVLVNHLQKKGFASTPYNE